MSDLRGFVRDYADFPKKGILFRDISPLLGDPGAFSACVHQLATRTPRPEVVVGIESRGFLFGSALALHWGLPFVPARKFGKLPGTTVRQLYSLEYGEDTLEIQADAIGRGRRVVIVDDLLATGGTAKAATLLIEQLGASVQALLFVIELEGLGGRAALSPHAVESLMRFEVSKPAGQ